MKAKTLLTTRRYVHNYWANPPQVNSPENYLMDYGLSTMLFSRLEPHVDRDSSILELGCNVGRNLNRLYEAGFHNLVGVELNRDAIAVMRSAFPEMAADTTVHHGTIESLVPSFGEGEFDAVFTVAVLEHIHWRSMRVIRDIPRITRDVLITVEDEKSDTTKRHFPRNYGHVFSRCGMRQVSAESCETHKKVGPNFYCRVFKKDKERTVSWEPKPTTEENVR